MYFQIHHLAIKAFRPKYSIQGGTRCSVLPSQQLLLSYYLQMANPPHFLTTKILLLFPTLASWQYKRKHIHRKCQKMLQNLGRRLLPGYMISCSWRSSNLSLQPSSAETSQKTPSWRSSETPWLGPLPSSLFPSPPPSLTPQIFFFKPAMFSNMLSCQRRCRMKLRECEKYVKWICHPGKVNDWLNPFFKRKTTLS